MSTIAQNLARSTPLPMQNRTSPASRPTEPGDRVDLRGPSEEHGHRALALAALALTGIGTLMGVASPAMAQEQPAPVQTDVQPQVDRHTDPINDAQWTTMQKMAEPNASDNASARDAKQKYSQVGELMLEEADNFKASSTRLETVGKRLEYLGKEIGNGTTSTDAMGTVTVKLKDDGISVTQVKDGVTSHVERDGDHLVVEQNDGHGVVRLDDTVAARSVQDGQTTRTLFLQNSLLHPAGEFEVATANRSFSETTDVSGPRILRERDSSVMGYVSRETISEADKWDAPHQTNADGPAVTLEFNHYRSSFNKLTKQTVTSFREVEVRADGSARVRMPDPKAPADALELVEPARVEPPATTPN